MSKPSTTSSLPDRPTFDQAAAAAIAEHSGSRSTVDDSPDADTPDDADVEDDDTEQADAGDDEQSDRTPEGHDDDDDDTDETDTGDDPPATRVAKPTTSELLSDDEFRALQTKHKDDPAALRKALEGAFTKKTQQLAEQRRSVERLQQYADIIDAYETDPEATVRTLAKELGLTVAEARTVADTVTEAATPTETAETAAQRAETLVNEFRTELGPDLEYLADSLAPAILKLVEKAASPLVDSKLAPLTRGVEAANAERANAITTQVMSTFEAKHPEFKDQAVQDRMFELSQRIEPQKGTSETDYLEMLFTLATHDSLVKEFDQKVETSAAKKAKAAIEKMAKGARDAGEPRTTPERNVKTGPPQGRVPTFDEAAAAAKRGERWER